MEKHKLLLRTFVKYFNCIHLSFQGLSEGLRKERDMLKLVESRLTQEKDMIVSQQQSQKLLMTNLQAIQVNLIISTHSLNAMHAKLLVPNMSFFSRRRLSIQMLTHVSALTARLRSKSERSLSYRRGWSMRWNSGIC